MNSTYLLHRPPGALLPREDGAKPATDPDRSGAAPIRRSGGAPLGPRLGAPGADRAAALHRDRLHLGSERVGLREQLLRGRRAGGDEELEGDVLRLARLVELHHGGQAARVAVGDGDVRADLRLRQLEHAGAAGAGGRRGGGAAVRRDQALVRGGRRPAGGSAAGDHPGRGADVPLQQPRRAARVPARRERVLPDPRDRASGHQVGDRGRNDDRPGVPREDDAGVPRAAGVRAGLPRGRPHGVAPAPRATARRRAGDRRQLRLVGGDRGAVAGELASDDRRLARQQHLQPDLRLQRPRADLRLQRSRAVAVAVVEAPVAARASAARPGPCGCSTT